MAEEALQLYFARKRRTTFIPAGYSTPAVRSRSSTEPQPGISQSRDCPVCSTTRARRGLCLDCAERQALEEEEASAPPQQAFHLANPQADHAPTSPSLAASQGDEPNAASLEASRSVPEQDTREPRHSRVSFALSGNDRARRASDHRRRQRWCADDPLSAELRPRSRQCSGNGGDAAHAKPSVPASQEALDPFCGAERGNNQSSNGLLGLNLPSQGNALPSESLQDQAPAFNPQTSRQERNAFISQLAGERLRKMLGVPGTEPDAAAVDTDSSRERPSEPPIHSLPPSNGKFLNSPNLAK